MSGFQRVVLLVLDGVGIGALPDAALYGDEQAATLPHVAEAVGGIELPQLQTLGIGNVCVIPGVPAQKVPQACWGRMAECSAGKDSVTGHWELMGLQRRNPFATYPQGFPEEIVSKFERLAGCRPLGNCAASGTEILDALGEEHLASGRPIVYTSSDSVFQIAAHEELLAPQALYDLCRRTLEMVAPFGICRVIARPFVGRRRGNFRRTSRRHDFPVPPGGTTLLDLCQASGVPTCGIGKIGDLFAGRGLDRSLPTKSNREGMAILGEVLKEQRRGLIFANLVDFDMLYGHRCDAEGFAVALADFDRCLIDLMAGLAATDLLLITADHGCDPTTAGTDHCREYVPLLAWSPTLDQGVSLGVRASFADVGATLAEIFALSLDCGNSFLSALSGCESAA